MLLVITGETEINDEVWAMVKEFNVLLLKLIRK